MKALSIRGLMALAAVVLLGAATPAQAPGAAAFVRAIYAHYPAPDSGPWWDPMGRSAAVVFDESTAALIRQARRAAGDEVSPGLDADYFCQCQDDSGLRWTLVSVTASDTLHARAIVQLRFTEERGRTERVLIDLVRTRQGWRVHDIRTPSGSSFRSDLREGIRLSRVNRR